MNTKVYKISEKEKCNIINAIKSIKHRILFYVLIEKNTNEVLSMRIELIDNNYKIEDWIAGTTEKVRKLRITTYFVYEILLNLKNKNYKLFDWNGANTKGVADFKRNYNDVLRSYTELKYKDDYFINLKNILKKLLRR